MAGDDRQRFPRALAVPAITIWLAALLTGACSPSAQVTPAGSPGAPFTLTITPAAGTKDLPVSTEVGIAVADGEITDVTMTQAGGGKLAGSMRADGTSWIPDAPLGFSTTYDVSVTGRSADGRRTETRTTSFTTMAKPAREVSTGFYLFNGETVGIGMPVVVEFTPPVPEPARADVQKRLFVTTNPPQPGVWHWPDGRQIWYRAPEYWRPGTTISVRAALQGVPMGNGRYGDADWSATVTVGEKVVMTVDNATKQMQVHHNDSLARTIPVSLGKRSTPSSSGHMVVMAKAGRYRFDTRGEPDGGYVVDVDFAMRLTWGGEFIHAAPWSVGDQGRRNVSHGCVNMSWGNAKWLYDVAHVGDPVIVKGTEVEVENGNGWTAWNMPWAEYIKGSALPVPAELAATPATSAPATSGPATSAPATSAPATGEPATSAPATGEPATSAPATGEPGATATQETPRADR
jgi:lipoprotein-anchoring transpeptidase ErfK/SrfK